MPLTALVASAAALALAAVLAVAAVGKLRHPARTAAGFARLGLPAPAVAAGAVPAVELAVAAALLVVPGWGGVAAFALLAGFTAYLLALLRSGSPVACGCFGSSGDRPVSALEVVRNALLLGAAALAAAHGGGPVATPRAVALAVAATAVGALLLRWSAPRLGPAGRTTGAGRSTDVTASGHNGGDEGGSRWPSW